MDTREAGPPTEVKTVVATPAQVKGEEEILLASVRRELEQKDREQTRLDAAEKELGKQETRLIAAKMKLEKDRAGLVAAREELEKDRARLVATKRELEEKIKEKQRLKTAGEEDAKKDKKAGPEAVEVTSVKKTLKEKPPRPRLKTPAGVKAKATSPTEVDLSWDAAPGGAAGYNVYRDGVFLKSVTGTSLSQTDLNPDTSYCYTIAAVDAAGKESKKSQDICTKTLVPDGEPPAVPMNLIASAVSPFRVKLSWNASSDNIGVTGYNVYQDGDVYRTVEGTFVSATDLKPDTTYCYVVTAYDAAGNESPHSDEACSKTLYEDKKRPTPPADLTIAELEHNQIDLSWGSSMDDVGVVGYNIYQDGVFLKAVASTSAFSIEVGQDKTHCYSITATDSVGNESRRSRQVCVTRKRSAGKGETWGGTVWAGGSNKYGQLGLGTADDKFTLVMVEGLNGIVSVAAAVEHTVALKADGTVWTWGRNNKGQLGDGTLVDRHAPVQVKGLTDVVDVAAGKAHSVVLKSDGTVWTWGRNYYGQLGDGTLADRHTPVQVKGLKDVIDVAAGWYHTVALESDGTVWAWGWNRRGQLGDGSTDTSRKPVKVEVLSDIEVVAAGTGHTVALKSDGTVWTWGWNEYGQLGDGITMDMLFPIHVKGLTNIVDVAAGMQHTVALESDGSVWVWGGNKYGQLGSSKGIKFTEPVMVEGIDGVQEIAAGTYHTVTLKADGSVWAWGWRSNVRYANKEAVPAQISGLTGIVDVAAGKKYSMAVKGR